MAQSELVIKLKTLLDKGLINKQVSEIQTALNKVRLGDIAKDINPQLTKLKASVASLSFKNIIDDSKTLVAKLKESIFTTTGLGNAFKNVAGSFGSVNKGFNQIDSGLQNSTKSASKFGGALSIAVGSFAGQAAMQGINLLVNGVKSMAQAGIDYESALADFSAITGVSGQALDDFGVKAKNLAAEFGTSAVDQVSTFKGILSRLGPDIAKSPEALEKMTVAINTLGKASGLTAAESMDALTTAALQMGIDLSDPTQAAAKMTDFMNVLAAGAQQGAAEVPQVAEAMVVAGVAAKGANLSFEEMNAAIQTMATGGKYGAEAGTALRNVLGLMQRATGPAAEALQKMGLSSEELGQTLTTQGLNAALQKLQNGMQNLGTDAEKNNALMTIFGMENAAAAQIMIDNADAMGTLQQKITGTNTGFEQAGINMDTFASKMDKLKSNIQNVGLDLFSSLEEPLGQAFSVIGETIVPSLAEVFKSLTPVITEVFNTISTTWQSIFPVIQKLITAIVPLIQPLLSLFSTLMVAISPILDVLVSALVPVINDIVNLINIIVVALNPILPILGTLIATLLQGLLIPLVPLIRLTLEAFTLLVLPLQLVIGLFSAIAQPIANLLLYLTNLIQSLFQVPFDWFASGLSQMSAAFSKVIQFVKDLVGKIGGLITQFLKFIGLVDKEKKVAPLKVETNDKDLEKVNDAVKKNTAILDENTLGLGKNTTANKSQSKEIKSLLTAYKQLQTQLDYTTKLQQIYADRVRLTEGREKNIYDEAIAYQQQQEQINALNTELSKYIEKYQVVLNEDGTVSFGAKLDEKNKEEIANEVKALKIKIEEGTNAQIDIKAKIQANDEAFNQKILDLEEQELDFKVKIGTVGEAFKLDNIRIEYNENSQLLRDYQTLLEDYEARKGDLSLEELARMEDIRKKYIETRSQQIKLNNELYDAEKQQAEATASVTMKLLEEKFDLLVKQQNKVKELYTTIAEYTNTVVSGNVDSALDDKLEKLNAQKEAGLLAQEVYEKEKLKIQEYYNNLKYVKEQVHLAEMAEMQKQTDIRILKEKKAMLEINYVRAMIAGNKELSSALQSQMDEIEAELKTKGDFLQSFGENLGNTIATSFSVMFEGKEEDLKRPWRQLFAITATALKTQLELLIVNLAQKQLEKISFFTSGLGAALALPAIIGVLRGLLGGMLTPVTNAIASFSTGGRVDEPTLAIVGDASRSRVGKDTEWILRDDQIKWIVGDTINKFQKASSNDFKMLAKDLSVAEFNKLNSIANYNPLATDTPKQIEIKASNIDLKPLLNLNPVSPNISTTKLEKLMEKFINTLENKNFNIELDGTKLNKELQRERNRLKYV